MTLPQGSDHLILSSFPCIQHENQNAVAYGCRETSKLEGIHFLKVTDVRYMYPTLYAKTKFQTNVSKAKTTTNANMDNKCRKAKTITNATLPFWSWNFYMYFPITPCICESRISNQRRTTNANMDNKRRKAKRTTNATLPFWSGNFFLIAPFPDDCLLLPFYALVDVYFVCVTCLSLG